MRTFRKLPLGTVTLAELTETVASVVKYVAAPAMNGNQLLEQQERRMAENPVEEFDSGVPQLDKLMNGFGGSRVIEISGDRASGKTVIVLDFFFHASLLMLLL